MYSPIAAPAAGIGSPSSNGTGVSAGFAPAARVRTPAQHARVWREGKRRYYGPLVVITCPNPNGQARLGFAISKRSQPRAVDRNRTKRLLRESFRHVAAELPAVDIVISMSRKVRMRTEADLHRALQQIWAGLKSSC